VVLVLLLAFVSLYILPNRTDTDFAWTIMPPTFAILMGSGYIAGAYFFARVTTEKRWHRVQAGFLAITAFTVCMFAATLLHWSRFHHGTLPFYAWTVIYAVTPFFVPILWWRNQASTSADLEANDLRFSTLLRWLFGVVAVLGIVGFVIGFIQPALMIPAAPWKLTELTARVSAGWSILILGTVLTIALDGRWSATRILVESAMIGIAVTLLALPRMWPDFDQTKPISYIFIAGLALGLIGCAIIHLQLDRKSSQKKSPGRA
jgi:uncharacterized membrane protein YciS (DUF1049 family)